LAQLLVPAAFASDHADPINLDRQAGGITDLFVFPTKDGVRRVPTNPRTVHGEKRSIGSEEANQLAVILCVRRSLTTSPPYPGLDEFTYTIVMDLHSRVNFDDDLDRKRYGGTVVHPEGIDADMVITIRLNADTTFKELKLEVKEHNSWKEKPAGRIQRYSGVRDDPFIFPMFFGTNVIAMVMSVPLDYFPGPPQDFVIWATSTRHRAQIDHVGRSQRTQLPRFDLLNTLHPKEHVKALRQHADAPGLIDDFLRTRIPPVFNLRPYDFKPDVMIFTRRPDYPAAFPNGRQLEDDVAKLTCEQGDCQLYELSFAVKDPHKYRMTGGRPTTNDKEFYDSFPYLAEPWPDKEPVPGPKLTTKNQTLVAVLFLFVAAVFLLPWFLYFRTLSRLRVAVRQVNPPRLVPRPAGQLEPGNRQ
jgi:hypothetical protein